MTLPTAGSSSSREYLHGYVCVYRTESGAAPNSYVIEFRAEGQPRQWFTVELTAEQFAAAVTGSHVTTMLCRTLVKP